MRVVTYAKCEKKQRNFPKGVSKEFINHLKQQKNAKSKQ